MFPNMESVPIEFLIALFNWTQFFTHEFLLTETLSRSSKTSYAHIENHGSHTKIKFLVPDAPVVELH